MNLYEPTDESRRRQLRRMGWKPIFHFADGTILLWERPDETRPTEPEAFARLDAMGVLEAERDVG